MSDITVNSFEEVIQLFSNDVINILSTEGLETLKDIETENIQEYVYDAHDPLLYPRRYENEGLLDKDNIVINNINKNKSNIEISFTNNTLVNESTYDSNVGDYLDEIIEYGINQKNTPYNKPRPFIQPTEDKIREEEIFENLIKKELDYVK